VISPVCAWSLCPTVFDSIHLYAPFPDSISVKREAAGEKGGKVHMKVEEADATSRLLDCPRVSRLVAGDSKDDSRTVSDARSRRRRSADIPQSQLAAISRRRSPTLQSFEEFPEDARRSRSRSCPGHGDGAPMLGHSRFARGQEEHRDPRSRIISRLVRALRPRSAADLLTA